MRATELIRVKHRWIKGTAFSGRLPNGDYASYCSLGAIHMASCEVTGVPCTTGSTPHYDATVEALMRHANISSVPSWNDNPERTHEEVVAAFCTAVKKELGDGSSTDTKA